jgi:hypothetical protein
MPFINKRIHIKCQPHTIRVVKDPIDEYVQLSKQLEDKKIHTVGQVHFDEITALKEELKEKDKKIKEFETMVSLLFHDFTTHDDKLGEYIEQQESQKSLGVKELFSPTGEIFTQELEPDTPATPTL